MVGAKKDETKESVASELGRYETFQMANDWLSLLYHTDEVKGMSNSEIAKKAFEDISSGRITQKDIDKATKEKEKSAKTDEKPEADTKDKAAKTDKVEKKEKAKTKAKK